jgi:prolyl oligopeptidase
MDWVKARNAKSQAALTGDPLYAPLHEEIRSILVAKDRIPTPALRGGWVYNFWQDSDHVKGLWRRVRPAEYAKADPAWEIILDLDALAKQEGESWVWKGTECLPPVYARCLLKLSRGGKDASVVREFDVEKHEFVKDGFSLPEAKSHVSWMDADAIWVGTDFGAGSLTRSGYPRLAKIWRRGSPLAEAKTVFEGKVDDVSVEAFTIFAPDRAPVHVLMRSPSFFESEASIYGADGKVTRIPFPRDADFKGVYEGYALALLRSQWKEHKQGSLVAIELKQLKSETVYAPDLRSTLGDVNVAKDALYLDVLKDVQGQLLKVTHRGKRWISERRPFPDRGMVHLTSADPFGREILVSFESFLVPTTLYEDGGVRKVHFALKRLPARFDAAPFEVKQLWAVRKDGTKIPYFFVGKKGMKLDREQPTLLYGYGGFEVSETPFYLGAVGKAWLERGGAYALANIRGGGEFGPRWHEAALKDRRQRAYDDFIAVAADLNRLHFTRPERLGIMGGSNGGLLMGVMLTQRPDLFGAIVCQVPLLDMLRYPKLLAGASWMGEYGDPEDPGYGPVIARYSPYQNVKRELKYPRVFIETSTKDDRVHPGHARKMVARLEELGKGVIYYENIEGGHSAAADLEQRARRNAMEYTYLWQQLGQKSGAKP